MATRKGRKGCMGDNGRWIAQLHAGRWRSLGGWLEKASEVRAASMAGVNLEKRDFINWHGSQW
jgi:hypothetical protein